MTWRTAFFASIGTLLPSSVLLGFGVSKGVSDGVTLSYLIENQHDCQAHVDLLHAAAKGRLTRDDFAGLRVVVARGASGGTKVPVSPAMVTLSFDDRGRYETSSFSTSAPSP